MTSSASTCRLVIVAHGGSATAFKADVAGAHSSPLTSEVFAVMKAGDRDTLVFMQNGEPPGLYCADETDGETLRVCEQIKESLYSYQVGSTATQPALATACTPSDDLTVWTCTLRDGVTFHNGATLDASDVVLSFAAQWDAIEPAARRSHRDLRVLVVAHRSGLPQPAWTVRAVEHARLRVAAISDPRAPGRAPT